MIQTEDLSLAYRGDLVFEGVSFTINPGERIGLVGRNGSGKTTLLRLLIGKEKPDSGTISFSKGYRLGYLDQHIRFTKPTLLEEAALGLREEEKDCLYLAEKMLFGLGFKEEDLDASPSKFSGGYQLRLHLAKVLISEPDCLLLDEPTNYLDILSMRFLTRFLKSWKGELILISHDREFMDSITTHTIGIHRKKTRKIEGSSVEFYNQILLDEEIYEKTRANLEKKREHMQSFIDRYGATASKAGQAQSRKKMLDRIPALEGLKKLYDLGFNFQEAPFYGKKMLEAKELNFAYPDCAPLIKDFSLSIERGERIAIIGKNGYGKSTLIRLLTNELKSQSGFVTHAEKLSIGYFGQTHIQRLDESKTIEEEIAQSGPSLKFSEVRRIAGQMMFSGDLAKKKIGVLSGGERSRVLLGKILVKSTNLLLLDEPTHHLDVESIEALIDALEDFQGSYVIVTHSELILKRLPLNKLIVCHQDRQELFLGNYDEFLDKMGWEEEGSKKTKPEVSKKEPSKTDKKKDSTLSTSSTKSLKTIESEMRKMESALVVLEEKQQNLNQQILEMSQNRANSEKEKLQAHLKSLSIIEKEIQNHYLLLERLLEEYEQKKQESTS